MDILKWIQNWYKSNCNGDWEHGYGVKIETIDNPGWGVKIDLKGTKWENVKLDPIFVDKGDLDWYSIKLENNSFEAACDPDKLSFVLNIFKELIQK